MRILAIGDPHGTLPKHMNRLVKGVDIIIVVGEIPVVPIKRKRGESWPKAYTRTNKEFASLVAKLCSFQLPVIVMRGDAYRGSEESNKITRRIFSKHKNLIHKHTGFVTIQKQTFVLFDSIYEKDVARNLNAVTLRKIKSNPGRKKKLNALLKKHKDAIFVTHVPPRGYVDKIHSGKHVGSKIVLEAIKKHQPKLVLCGHIHEAKGKAKIKKSTVYNLGSHGEYRIFNV